MKKILLLNGPNLNLLGSRETQTYGSDTLIAIERRLKEQASRQGSVLECFQSNSEGALIDKIQAAAQEQTDFILINPGALTHTSIGLRDALLAVNIPFVEVHVSNIYQRETFRHRSYLSDVAQGVVLGFGTLGYDLALEGAIRTLAGPSTP